MLRLIGKIPFFILFYKFNYPKLLPINLTINLTYRCNLQCLTCNIQKWDNKKELDTKEYEKIFKSISRSIYFLTLTGGEVFLRDDLIRICELINDYIQPEILTIPTNGYDTELIIRKTEKIVKIFNNTKLILNLSLDGKEEVHNKIRGKDDAFEALLRTYYELSKINNKNFIVGIGVCISKYNIDKLDELIEFVITNLKPTSFVFEPAQQRYELNNRNNDFVITHQDYLKIMDRLISIKNKKAKGILKLKEVIRKEYYRTLSDVLNNKRVLTCYAGFTSAHIMPSGEVLQCCIKDTSFGNIKEYDYNFKKLWTTPEVDKLRKMISKERCYCTLANVFYTNCMVDIKRLLKLTL